MKEENIIYEIDIKASFKDKDIADYCYTYKVEHKKIKNFLENGFYLSSKNLISIIENSVNDKVFVIWIGQNDKNENGEECFDAFDFKFFATIMDCLNFINEIVKQERENEEVAEIEEKIVINKIDEV